MTILKLALLSALVMIPTALAVAQPTTAPHWCEDLGLVCMTAGGGQPTESALYVSLGSTDPKKFLPADLAAFVLECEQIRAEGDLAKLGIFKTARNPLKGAVQELMFIPKDRVKAADLPASGARLVVDCAGKSIQLRDDLKPEKRQHALLKTVFNNVTLLESSEKFQYVRGYGFSPQNPRVSVRSCDMGTSYQATTLPKIPVSFWDYTSTGLFRAEASEIAPSWIHAKCFPPKKTAPASTPSKK